MSISKKSIFRNSRTYKSEMDESIMNLMPEMESRQTGDFLLFLDHPRVSIILEDTGV